MKITDRPAEDHADPAIDEPEAAISFPDQNPNPVIRATLGGQLVYANAASLPIRRALGVTVGEVLPASFMAEVTAAAASSPPELVELECGLQTFAVLAMPVPGIDALNIYGTDITGAKVVEKFPDRNPNPVLRMAPDGTLMYANTAAATITRSLRIGISDPLPADLQERIRRRGEGAAGDEPIEVSGEGRSYSLVPVPIPEFGFTNLYATDVTALHAINKFPDENPNPVLRISRDGILTYANPASALVREAWGAQVGDQLDPDLFRRLGAIADGSAPNTLESEKGGRLFALLVVSVFEFDSINVYGTDISAAREVEKANEENERLLLNILPPSIAERLRHGEGVIADRFEEMAILFADVVSFTPFAADLSPTEVVEILNSIFSVFDRLADAYELEKIKTIGDSYMVVGGFSPDRAGQVEQVAHMGLDMIDELERYRTPHGRKLEIRVGMHVGPTIGGVIGLKKFIYDVWGDAVNTASRMESHGVPGRIHVTEATYERLKEICEFESRGMIEVKGKGRMPTYFLVGRRTSAPTEQRG